MKYRPDIDGLRAIAVLAVLFFHVNKNFLPGGFVGVDIFFVISGFLITSLIYPEMLSQKFSFGNFYMRRLRRIQPIMWLVTLATFLVGLIVLSPTDLQFLANSIRSVLTFTTNFFFAKNSNYFNPDTEQYPLLHFWSLAVEEQYYLFWPLLLLTLHKMKMSVRGILWVSGILIVSSTVLGEFWARDPLTQKLAYFLLPSRIGELSIGGALAIAASTKRFGKIGIRPKLRNVLSVSGLALLCVPFFLFNEHTTFPGFASILPCVGAFCVILSGPLAFVNRQVLASRVFVFVGSISYSLYLWHFPVLAYLKYLGQLNLASGLVAIGLIFGLSAWSKAFVEDQFRHANFSFWNALWRFQLKPGLIGLFVVIVTYDSGGLKQRYFLSHSDIIEDMNPFYENYCHQQILSDCRIGDKSNPAKILLFGDSHANHFMPFWESIAADEHFSIEARSATACAPVFADIAGDESICAQQKKWFRENFQDYPTIILNARWEYIFTDFKFPASITNEIQKQFAGTLAILSEHHINVIVMPQIPSISDTGYDKALKEKYFLLGFYRNSSGREVKVNFTPNADLANQRLLKFLENFKSVVVFDPVAACPEIRQRWPYREGGMAYRDDNHLTLKGAQGLADCWLGKNLPLPLKFK